MITTVTPQATDSEALKQALMPPLQEALAAGRRKPQRVVRVETPVELTDAQAWFSAQPHPIKLYWWGRDRVFEMAGIGTAFQITGEQGIKSVIDRLFALMGDNDPNMRAYGGLAFDADTAPPAPWDTFGNCQFIVPRIELINRSGRSYLACHAIAGIDSCADSEIEAVAQSLDGLSQIDPSCTPELPELVSRRDRPEKPEWTTSVNEILEHIASGSIAKAVLARESIFQFSQAPCPATLMRRLSDMAARSFLFCFQPRLGTAFVGASPERLYRRTDRRLESEAIAGTRPRGDNAQADQVLSEALLASGKDRHEHRFVADAIRKAFDRLCACTRHDDRVSLLQLRQCQHLLTTFEGTLAKDISDAVILETLHPTPAVGGTPRDVARTLISQLEPFHRGWYAGSVGWVSPSGADFAVAIRTALLHGHSVAAHCGAGIVDASEPQAEWEEIETKMRVMAAVLSGDHE